MGDLDISTDRTSSEMIRVRVRFLKPGDLIQLSDLDNSITSLAMVEKRDIFIEDYWDTGIFRVSSAELAESIHLPGDIGTLGVISCPNDPVIEMTCEMWVVYFDLLELDPDWEGKGGIGWCITEVGLYDTFERFVPLLVKHAQSLKGHQGEDGLKVQFLTLWSYSSWSDYWGEWDCDHTLEGWFAPGGELQSFTATKSMMSILAEVLSDKEGLLRAQEEAKKIMAQARAESDAQIERLNAQIERMNAEV